MLEDVIELLLEKKAGINDEREQKIAAAVAEINREFESRETKIDALLETAGYVPPVAEPIAEVQPEERAEPESEQIVEDLTQTIKTY